MPLEGFEECAIDLSQLYVGRRFAEGTFGKLYQGVYRRQDVAVKILKLPDIIEGDRENQRLRELVAKQFWQETAMLATLQHDNVVQVCPPCHSTPCACVPPQIRVCCVHFTSFRQAQAPTQTTEQGGTRGRDGSAWCSWDAR